MLFFYYYPAKNILENAVKGLIKINNNYNQKHPIKKLLKSDQFLQRKKKNSPLQSPQQQTREHKITHNPL